jgi:hypothetical protein
MCSQAASLVHADRCQHLINHPAIELIDALVERHTG